MVSPSADSVRYHTDPAGEWAVLDYDGNPKPERWLSEDDAWQYGVAGKYLLSGCGVSQIPSSETPDA